MPDAQARIIVNDLLRTAERAMIDVTLQTHANLTVRTPIDTGWARSNWIPRIGQPSNRPIGSKDNVGAAVAENAAAIQATRRYRIQNFRAQRIHITNNVPYIRLLNEGSSRQAPAGFVQQAIRDAVANTSRRFIAGTFRTRL